MNEDQSAIYPVGLDRMVLRRRHNFLASAWDSSQQQKSSPSICSSPVDKRPRLSPDGLASPDAKNFSVKRWCSEKCTDSETLVTLRNSTATFCQFDKQIKSPTARAYHSPARQTDLYVSANPQSPRRRRAPPPEPRLLVQYNPMETISELQDHKCSSFPNLKRYKSIEAQLTDKSVVCDLDPKLNAENVEPAAQKSCDVSMTSVDSF